MVKKYSEDSQADESMVLPQEEVALPPPDGLPRPCILPPPPPRKKRAPSRRPRQAAEEIIEPDTSYGPDLPNPPSGRDNF